MPTISHHSGSGTFELHLCARPSLAVVSSNYYFADLPPLSPARSWISTFLLRRPDVRTLISVEDVSADIKQAVQSVSDLIHIRLGSHGVLVGRIAEWMQEELAEIKKEESGCRWTLEAA